MHEHETATGRRLGLSVLLTALFVAGEAAAGVWSGSLALLSDAGHNLADALALAVSWYAVRAGRRPPDARRTFGYHRAGVLAALANALSLVGIAAAVAVEAARRLPDPPPVEPGPMVAVAAVAVVLNGLISVWLREAAKDDLNVRSAYLHMVGDALAALGVVAAGVVVALTGSRLADPVASLLIAGFVLWSSWGVLTEAVGVLMEAAPPGVDVPRVAAAVGRVSGVESVHDLHVWTLGSGRAACSAHVRVGPDATLADAQRVQAEVARLLEHDFGVAHTTVQVEADGCGATEIHCSPRPVRPHDDH